MAPIQWRILENASRTFRRWFCRAGWWQVRNPSVWQLAVAVWRRSTGKNSPRSIERSICLSVVCQKPEIDWYAHLLLSVRSPRDDFRNAWCRRTISARYIYMLHMHACMYACLCILIVLAPVWHGMAWHGMECMHACMYAYTFSNFYSWSHVQSLGQLARNLFSSDFQACN
jgi:hypothetical protein